MKNECTRLQTMQQYDFTDLNSFIRMKCLSMIVLLFGAALADKPAVAPAYVPAESASSPVYAAPAAAPSYSAPAPAPAYSAPAAPAYNAPAAAAPAPAYSAPAAPSYNAPAPAAAAPDTYGSPQAAPVANDEYGSPQAPPVSQPDAYGAPKAPVQSKFPSKRNKLKYFSMIVHSVLPTYIHPWLTQEKDY